jgi:hypothetical protein
MKDQEKHCRLAIIEPEFVRRAKFTKFEKQKKQAINGIEWRF